MHGLAVLAMLLGVAYMDCFSHYKLGLGSRLRIQVLFYCCFLDISVVGSGILLVVAIYGCCRFLGGWMDEWMWGLGDVSMKGLERGGSSE